MVHAQTLGQQSYFTPEVKVEVAKKPDPITPVRLGHREARINLAKKRREALAVLMPILKALEGKDVYIGSYFGGSSNPFWVENLKLGRMQLETYGSDPAPGVIALWGQKDCQVRIFTDQVINVRTQEYSGYTMWLIDFWNGFPEHPIDKWRPPGYNCITVKRFKD